ncbi:MAG TPA: replication-relaxation family protein [Galbitalea sp.]|jgi:hypothetical protein|nr:replication-relaxation family protein [Galbitalea sp.]
MNHDRMGADKLVQLLEHLSPMDHAVLARLQEHPYLQTVQVARFDFAERPTQLAAVRAAHRALKKLRVLGLVFMMERTIGGPARGSTAAVWTITNTGQRAASLHAGEGDEPRRRLSDPTTVFLRHQVAVADLHLALLDAAKTISLTLRHFQIEPLCWRRYVGPLGGMVVLKPDLAVDVDSANFISRYFFEVDRATEAPSRILTKCLQYQEYYRSGEEERRGEVLPLVIWVVPTEARREQILRHLTTHNGINPRLFRVVLGSQVSAVVGEDDEVGRLPENLHTMGSQS